MTEQDLDALLDECRRLNTEYGISGMLLYFETAFHLAAEGRFIQVIEGEKTDIDHLFANISADSRHSNITLLNRQDITRRDFKDWTMGFQAVAVSRPDRKDAFFELSETILEQKNGKHWNRALNYLKDFYALRSR